MSRRVRVDALERYLKLPPNPGNKYLLFIKHPHSLHFYARDMICLRMFFNLNPYHPTEETCS